MCIYWNKKSKMQIYSDFLTCLSKYPSNKEKWINLMAKQQQLLEDVDKCNCDKEFKNFMIRKHRMENMQCVESSKISMLEYCQNFNKLIETKEKLLDRLSKVRKCEDFDEILKEFK